LKLIIIRKRKKLTLRFTEDNGGINKSVVCYIKSAISLHYVKPKVCVCPKHIDLVIIGVENTVLCSTERFVKDVIFPRVYNIHNCNGCESKKRPPFCIYNKAAI